MLTKNPQARPPSLLVTGLWIQCSSRWWHGKYGFQWKDILMRLRPDIFWFTFILATFSQQSTFSNMASQVDIMLNHTDTIVVNFVWLGGLDSGQTSQHQLWIHMSLITWDTLLLQWKYLLLWLTDYILPGEWNIQRLEIWLQFKTQQMWIGKMCNEKETISWKFKLRYAIKR